MSVYAISKQTLDAAIEQASGEGLDATDLLRAMLGTLVEKYRELAGVEDTKNVLQYQLENASGDDDIAFMRP
jgi:hypothetical protein